MSVWQGHRQSGGASKQPAAARRWLCTAAEESGHKTTMNLQMMIVNDGWAEKAEIGLSQGARRPSLSCSDGLGTMWTEDTSLTPRCDESPHCRLMTHSECE